MTLPDIDSTATFGGILSNYWPVEDPTTDLDAGADNQNRCSTAAMTNPIHRAWARFITSATTPTFPVSNFVGGVWPTIPANQPTLARSSQGVFTLTYPTTVTDELGVVHTLNFRAARASAEGSTWIPCQASVTAANVVTVNVFAGQPNQLEFPQAQSTTAVAEYALGRLAGSGTILSAFYLPNAASTPASGSNNQVLTVSIRNGTGGGASTVASATLANATPMAAFTNFSLGTITNGSYVDGNILTFQTTLTGTATLPAGVVVVVCGGSANDQAGATIHVEVR